MKVSHEANLNLIGEYLTAFLSTLVGYFSNSRHRIMASIPSIVQFFCYEQATALKWSNCTTKKNYFLARQATVPDNLQTGANAMKHLQARFTNFIFEFNSGRKSYEIQTT